LGKVQDGEAMVEFSKVFKEFTEMQENIKEEIIPLNEAELCRVVQTVGKIKGGFQECANQIEEFGRFDSVNEYVSFMGDFLLSFNAN
jgi:hypothetical protein